MDQIWLRRIVRELIAQRSRTALTVLSIAIGLFAVSLTFRTSAILSANILAAYATTSPAAIVVELEPADPRLADRIRRIPGVSGVEGVIQLAGRALVGGTWQSIALSSAGDSEHQEVGRIVVEAEGWAAARRSMLIEQSFIDPAGVAPGQSLAVELDNGRRVTLPVAGAAHDMAAVSGRLGNPVLQGYISRDSAEWLSGSRDVNTFLVAVEDTIRGQAELRALGNQVKDQIEDAGYAVSYVRLRDPQAPEVFSILSAVFQLLSLLGGLSLMLSASLVVNTTSAMLTRHVPQIGVMKAIGGRSHDILRTYLSIVLVIALLAILASLPAAGLCAWLLAQQLAWLLNYSISDASVPPGVVAVELASGLLVPLLASAYPVWAAARLTVRAALSEARAGEARPGRLSTPVPGIPIAMLYAGRSMFRRKGRLALTMAALICGGAITIAVLSARASLFATLDQVAAYWQQDLTVTFNSPERASRVIAAALEVPGVVAAEQQPAILALRRRPNGDESELRYAIYGIQPASLLLQPTLVQGRWLDPGERDAIVVNVDLLKREPDLGLGDPIELKVGTRTTSWTIVGVATTHMLIYGDASIGQGVGYVNDPGFTQTIYRAQQANRLVITTASPDPAFRAEVGQALEARFAADGITALVQTQSAIRSQITGFVSLIIVLLLVMALSFAAIGALSLVGAMSLNVLERTKEVGVLRAIGSSHRQITQIVVTEGVCIGLMSWVPATLLALPLSRLLSDVLGWSMLSWPLVYVFPASAPLICAALIVLLAAGASYLPARQAARINVRNALEHL